ncbi:MAG: beta-ketoacyl-[acyl-carrier-protein] synthase II, partial [Rubrivivax sp.]
GDVELRGWGESVDAHHMSSPHPQGLGAQAALDDALARAALGAEAVDLVLLHGTGTTANDAVEAALVARRYAPGVHASATKGITGHTMGAAGALQAAVAVLALQRGLCPGSAPTAVPDAALGQGFAARFQARPALRAPRAVASHSFGFGGSNAVLVFAC